MKLAYVWVGALVLAGCFSEPPAASGDAGNATSGETEADTSTGGATSGAPTTTTVDPDSGSTRDSANDTGSTSTGADVDCEAKPALVAPTNASVVIIVDDLEEPERSEQLRASVASWRDASVLFIVPEGTVGDYATEDCRSGCGSPRCQGPVRAIGYSAVTNPLDAVLDEALYGCVFNAAGPTTRHFWFVTESPDATVPEGVAAAAVPQRAHFNVACPGCTEDAIDNNLVELADALFGSLANLDIPQALPDQAATLGAARNSCTWAPAPIAGFDAEQLFMLFTSDFLEPDKDGERYSLVVPVDSLKDCAALEGKTGQPGFAIVDGDVVLCPLGCLIAGAVPIADMKIEEVYCEGNGGQ